ncbi:MAG: helix-turn-helix domain-containing protein [Spirochaetaceae bacterium]|nr:helix-turn-helix domain-containing protein [Spirochaetaceae bacterium]
MESLGNKLRTARESKGCSYDQVSQETHIASRYLKALEEEAFGGFPGEPFLLGFLKNYSEFLGLDTQEVLSLYWAMKIQEEPVPVEQLLKPSPPFPFTLLIAALAGLILLGIIGGGVYFLLNHAWQKPPPASAAREPMEYTLSDGALERRFYQGDAVIIPYGDARYTVKLASLGDALTLSAPDREVMLDLGQEVLIDLNADGVEELRITAAEFSKNESGSGALLRFEIDAPPPLPPALAETPPPSADTRAAPAPAALSGTGLANAAVIFSSSSAYPFTLQAFFQGYCMFRWEILAEQNRRERTERYYQKGDELNIQAQNGIRVWLSNAATVKLQAIGGGRTVPLELGGAGEVVVAEIRWVWDDDSRYRLVLVKL